MSSNAGLADLHCISQQCLEDRIRSSWLCPGPQEECADRLVDFFEKCQEDDTYWDKISQGVPVMNCFSCHLDAPEPSPDG